MLSLGMANNLKLPERDKAAWVNARLDSMSLSQKIYQSFIVLVDLNWESTRVQETLKYALDNEVGGVVLRGGTISRAKRVVNQIRNKSLVPMFIAVEASYGLSESFFTENRYPYPLTLAAADSVELTKRIGSMIGYECADVGFNVNYTRVTNVFSNPRNANGLLNSFGENPRDVSQHSQAYSQALSSAGVIFAPMDFPGTGDVKGDSQNKVSNNSMLHIEAVDLMPFRSLISDGVKMIGMSNASYPALDSSGVKATVSKSIINDLLRGTLGFNELIVSSAMDSESPIFAAMSYLAGCDQLYKVKSPKKIHDLLVKELEEKQLSEEAVNLKCQRILALKYDEIVKRSNAKKKKYNKEWTLKTVYEKGIVAVRNNHILPIQRFDQKIALVSVGPHTEPLWSSISRTANVDCYHAYSMNEALERYASLMNQYDIVLTSVHTNTISSGTRHLKGIEKWSESLLGKQTVLSINGGATLLTNIEKLNFDAIIIAHENHPFALDRMGELLMGCVSNDSKLSVTLSEKFKRGTGVIIPWAGRLSQSHPAVHGISKSKLSEIDTIVASGMRAEAFPGCQVMAVYKGKVIYQKSFGYQTYDSLLPIGNKTIYDVASVTKVVSTTAAMMRLQSQGLFKLDDSLGDYLSLVDSTAYEGMVIREMMAHQAGLYPWIPFYTKTMSSGVHDSLLYSQTSGMKTSRQVSSNLWIDPNYEDVMYQTILHTKLGSKKYKYSDLGYYFLRKILTAKTGELQDDYMFGHFYAPMGLQTIGYNPLNRFSLERIAPTEDDKIFRKELVHGFVHDQGTAMLGGVGGHAGIFSNAWDLAAVMQMFLNGGKYGSDFISKEVIDEYTDCQFCPVNRRGAGFDKPVRSLQGGPTCNLVSLSSFGHSGFTGTFVWADPKYDINYVFLSNRVYPDAENWKIVKMNIRSHIQKVIYEAVLQGSGSN
jgi:beta-glucosidase-like glycosyl hydrolase/CubicO group peptidase (beta-lactamase class C family)